MALADINKVLTYMFNDIVCILPIYCHLILISLKLSRWQPLPAQMIFRVGFLVGVATPTCHGTLIDVATDTNAPFLLLQKVRDEEAQQ